MCQLLLKKAVPSTHRSIIHMPITPSNNSTSGSFHALNPAFRSESAVAQHASGQDPAAGNGAIDAYKAGVDHLSNALDVNDKTARNALDSFKAFLINESKNGSSASASAIYDTEVVQQFSQFCALVQENKLPRETLQKAIANLSKGLDASSPDTALTIKAAAKDLHALARGIPENFQKFSIQHQISGFMQTHAIPSDRSDYPAAFFNSIAHEYNLQKYSGVVDLTLEQSTIFKNYFKSEFNTEHVIKGLADSYLQRVHDIYGPEREAFLNPAQREQMQQKFKEEIQPELDFSFGTVEIENIFLRCIGKEERYQLAHNSALVGQSIARNLHAAGLFTQRGQPEPQLSPAQAALRIGTEVEQLDSALQNNDGARLAELISKARKEHLRTRCRDGNTLPMRALLMGNMEAAKSLIQKMDSEDLRVKNKFGNTLLAIALNKLPSAPYASPLKAGLYDIVGGLVDAMDSAALEMGNQYGNTALMMVLEMRHQQLAKMILQKVSISSLGLKNSQGNTALLIALGKMGKDQELAGKHAFRDSMSVFRHGNLQPPEPGEIAQLETSGRRDVPPYMVKIADLDSVALQIIERMQPEHLNIANMHANTAAMMAVYRSKTKAALALISRMDAPGLKLRNQEGKTMVELAQQKPEIVTAVTARLADLGGSLSPAI